jgi:hypothetical protein
VQLTELQEIGIVLLAAAGPVGLVAVQLRRRARKPVTWRQLVNAGTLDEALNANELVRFFFLVDSINPTDFLANYVDVSGSVQVKAPVEPGRPTRSTATFRQGENAPAGYPRWFLAAYPDVVVWLAAKDQDSMLRISAEAMYGPEGAKELIRIHGLKRISELMDEKFEGFDLGQLRRLVAGFRRETRKRLECAIVVKEKAPRRGWFEPATKPRSALAERVLSDSSDY